MTGICYINYSCLKLQNWLSVFAGMVTGMRGLCNGLGPAMFGLVFYMFNVDLTKEGSNATSPPPLFEPYSQVKI